MTITALITILRLVPYLLLGTRCPNITGIYVFNLCFQDAPIEIYYCPIKLTEEVVFDFEKKWGEGIAYCQSFPYFYPNFKLDCYYYHPTIKIVF